MKLSKGLLPHDKDNKLQTMRFNCLARHASSCRQRLSASDLFTNDDRVMNTVSSAGEKVAAHVHQCLSVAKKLNCEANLDVTNNAMM